MGWCSALGRCTNTDVLRNLADLDSENMRNCSIDIVDCTAMDTNVHGMRHSYFDLNVNVIADISDLVNTGRPASQRSRLVRCSDRDRSEHGRLSAYALVSPPSFVVNS